MITIFLIMLSHMTLPTWVTWLLLPEITWPPQTRVTWPLQLRWHDPFHPGRMTPLIRVTWPLPPQSCDRINVFLQLEDVLAAFPQPRPPGSLDRLVSQLSGTNGDVESCLDDLIRKEFTERLWADDVLASPGPGNRAEDDIYERSNQRLDDDLRKKLVDETSNYDVG